MSLSLAVIEVISSFLNPPANAELVEPFEVAPTSAISQKSSGASPARPWRWRCIVSACPFLMRFLVTQASGKECGIDVSCMEKQRVDQDTKFTLRLEKGGLAPTQFGGRL